MNRTRVIKVVASVDIGATLDENKIVLHFTDRKDYCRVVLNKRIARDLVDEILEIFKYLGTK